jgi:hypothetical protein
MSTRIIDSFISYLLTEIAVAEPKTEDEKKELEFRLGKEKEEESRLSVHKAISRAEPADRSQGTVIGKPLEDDPNKYSRSRTAVGLAQARRSELGKSPIGVQPLGMTPMVTQQAAQGAAPASSDSSSFFNAISRGSDPSVRNLYMASAQLGSNIEQGLSNRIGIGAERGLEGERLTSHLNTQSAIAGGQSIMARARETAAALYHARNDKKIITHTHASYPQRMIAAS